ncbi:MAG: histidine ammonia-lyase [Bacteroidota bacterium]
MSVLLRAFSLGEDTLTIQLALDICRGDLPLKISSATVEKLQANRDIVGQIVAGQDAVYGINTGFGPLCSTRISREDTNQLQTNIIKSHSVGMGDPVPDEVAKLMLILKLQALCQAHSGIEVATLRRLQWHVEQDIIPVVPEQGSVGASGDLAPLAHLFLPLIGLGWVKEKGVKKPAAEVLQAQGLAPIQLGAKEGLALINGTQFIAAYAILVVEKMHNCLAHADLIGAMMVDGLLGSRKPFLAALHQLRPYPGNQHVAQRLYQLLEGSDIIPSHVNCQRVQDPYSLRCMPQVHGASRTAWLHLKEATQIELNAVTDNPVIFSDGRTISGGNFHGQPLALPLDYACLAASEIGNISDRRSYLSLMGIADGVPKLLMQETGTNSAFMMLQYTSAALASENKGLCFPASADSIPTSLGQEDHVSMGSISGRKALQVCGNVEKILAVEMLCAAQALDFHHPLKTGPYLEEVHQEIRRHISHAEADRVFAEDMEKSLQLIQDKSLLRLIQEDSLGSPHHTLFESY